MLEMKKEMYTGVIHQGCWLCANPKKVLEMSTKLSVGFGDCRVTFNGETLWYEEPGMKWEQAPTVEKFENMAKKKEGDWEIIFYTSLHGEVYQRHGKDKWVMIESNMGFA